MGAVMNANQTVFEYLIKKLYDYGVRHVFGVPGDYALGFFHELELSNLEVVNTCDEQGAGFAADAYARVNGLGVVCVTYSVGSLKVANSTAQAFAEKSPVIVISGAPGVKERLENPLLHHKVGSFDTQLKVFEQLTVASTIINDAEIAGKEIDRVLSAAIRNKQPVYIELPRDMGTEIVTPYKTSLVFDQNTDKNVLKEALVEAVTIINSSKKPVILAGVEIHRFGFQKLLLKIIEKTNIPIACTLLGKTVISENHPRFLGIYEGAMGREDVKDYVESSDCLILLGTFMTDINLGIYTAHLEKGSSIYVTSEKISIHYHTFENIQMEEFLQGFLNSDLKFHKTNNIPHPIHPVQTKPIKGKNVSVSYLFQSLNWFLDDNTIVITDPGDAMFGAVDMTIHKAAEFLAPAYYASLGFAVPASIGTQLIKPKLRPLVLVGDGAFQMTGMELSTSVRYGLNPIIVVLNNEGYGTERPMLDGRFNDVLLWDFCQIPKLLNSGLSFNIKTEDQLEDALDEVKKYTKSFCILDVHLDPHDSSLALQRLTKALGKRISKSM